MTSCLGTDLGVQGGSRALSATFTGIDSATVISPTSVVVAWSPLADYTSYNIYSSTQDAPIGSSVFNSFTVTGLKPGTNYSFSVAGVRSDGGQDGIAKQASVSTWTPFVGPTSAVAVDSSDVKVVWNYFSGPSFQVYYSTGSPPSAAQLAGPPSASSQSNTGSTVGGLQPNTTYYFSVIAKYPDGTTNLQALDVNSTTITATYTTNPGNLIVSSLPSITTAATVLSTAYPVFDIANSPTTYLVTFFTGTAPTTCTTPFDPQYVLGQVDMSSTSGSTSLTATQFLPLGSDTVSVQIFDTVSSGCAYAAFSAIQSSANPASLIHSVSATTPTSLSPLPTISAPALQLGQFPSFTVSGALPGYKTTLNYNGQVIGTITGNGTIKTLSSTPLPRGSVEIDPVVTYNGQTAYLSPVTVKIKATDSLPTVGPTDINGGGAGGGVGTSMVTGDFNCDGYPDLAVSAPFAAFGTPPNGGYTAGNSWDDSAIGAVAVYYGSTSGLVGFDYHAGSGSITPVTAPTGLNPLLVPAPVTPANPAYAYGTHFGYSLAAGNINGVTANGHACSDLVVGAPTDYDDSVVWSTGAVYIYYGAPTGLQVTPYSYEGITCNQAGSYLCGTAKLSVPPGTPTRPGYLGYWSWGGLGQSVAVGDFNGDGYDDVAVGVPNWSDADTSADPDYYDGAVLLYWGTANGAAPSPQIIHMPQGTQRSAPLTYYAYFGMSVSFGYVSDDPVSPSGGTPFRKKDLLVGAPNVASTTGGGGVFWIQGTPNILANLDPTDQTHLVSGYAFIQPAQCAPGDPKYWNNTSCGYAVASADLNQDGYDDIVFSDPWAYSYNGWSYNGAVFAYYGSPAGPYNYTLPPVGNTTTCTNPNNVTNCNPHYFYRTDGYPNWFFGLSLTSLGNLNGSGYPAIGIGAPGAQPAHNAANYTYNGLGYVYFGSSLGLTSGGAVQINLGSGTRAYAGASMAAGDFANKTYGSGSCTGQKCADLVIGAPGDSAVAGAYSQGNAHLFQNSGSGFSGTLSTPTADGPVVPGKLTYEHSDIARIIGDVNGDGYADVAVSVLYMGPLTTPSWNRVWESYRWGVAIYYGSANGLTTIGSNGHGPSYTPLLPTDPLFLSDENPNYTSTGWNGNFGYIAMSAGDMNGDGFADLVTGYNTNLYFFYGSANGLISSPQPQANPASSLDPKTLSSNTWVGMYNLIMGAHGDFNGDGYGDLAIVRSRQSYTDPIMIIYGSANGPVTGGAILNVKNPGYPSSTSANNAVRTPTCSGTYPSAICQPLEICNGDTGSICGDLSGADPNIAIMKLGTDPNWHGVVGYVMNGGDLDKDGTDDLVVVNPWDMTLSPGNAQYIGAHYIYYGSTNGGLDPHRWAKIQIPPEYNPDPYLSPEHGDGWDGTGGLTKAYDVNGDGINDIVISSSYETTGPNGIKNYLGGAAYVLYGINGGYKSLGGAVCPSYPCTVTLAPAAGNLPDGNPTHLVENVNNSCDPSSGSCNPMRFYPYNIGYSSWRFGVDVLGLGDITGDNFGEIAVSATGRSPNGAVIIYSGSPSGLQVASQPTTQPSCSGGVCSPYIVVMPTDPSYTGYVNGMNYRISGWSDAGDVDKDGKRDFLIRSYWLNEPAGNGFAVGGWFLFH